MKTATTPKRGQKLYGTWNGELRTVTFIEQSVAEGAWAETWLLRDSDDRRFRTSVGSYEVTAYLAFQKELKNYEDGLKAQWKALAEARQNIKDTKATIVKLKDLVRRSRAD